MDNLNTSLQPVLKVAAKAVIVNDAGKVLILREASTDPENTKVSQWGLPGGRLEPGESFSDGLKREAREEAGLEVIQGQPLYVGEWRPVIRGVPHQIVAVFVKCQPKPGAVLLSDEHDAYKWINPHARSELSIMEPDCFVIDMLIDADPTATTS